MPDKKRKNIFTRFFGFLWSLFLNGLLTILPITITIVIFHVFFKLITSWLEPIREIILDRVGFLKQIPYVEVIIVIAAIFLLGTILKIFLLKRIVHFIEDLIARLPLVRTVYRGIKQLVKALGMQDQMSFKQVVLLEYPRKGVYCLGFLTSELPSQMAPHTEEKFFNIYLPTTPIPTSGYLVIAPEKDIIKIDISVKDAMSMIISGGIVQPERFCELPEREIIP